MWRREGGRTPQRGARALVADYVACSPVGVAAQALQVAKAKEDALQRQVNP